MGKDINDLFKELPECTADSVQGSINKIQVSKLRPTQNAVGYDEIYEKREKLDKKSADLTKLKDYLLQRVIPVIVGNDGKFYLIDHHHLAFSVYSELGDICLPVEVIRNWSPIEGYSFFKAMRENNWLYPFSGNGAGPLPPEKIKTHIKDLENDIFRSLSWVVRKKYGYVKSAQNAIFAEFKWGELLQIKDNF